MGQMTEKQVKIDRKMLSNIAIVFPEVFDSVYDTVVK